jgi:hypothetical protein
MSTLAEIEVRFGWQPKPTGWQPVLPRFLNSCAFVVKEVAPGIEQGNTARFPLS